MFFVNTTYSLFADFYVRALTSLLSSSREEKSMAKNASYISEYKTRLLTKYHQSNLSQSEFCNQEGIKKATFCHWLSRETEVSVLINSSSDNAWNLIDAMWQIRAELPEDDVRMTINRFRISVKKKDLSFLIGTLRND